MTTKLSTNIKDDIESYVDSALSVGERTRHNYCPLCQSTVRGKGFVVTRTRRGYMMYCFKCHEFRYLTSDTISIGGVRRIIQQRRSQGTDVETVREKRVSLPFDFTTSIPTQGLIWLRSGGVTDEEIQTYRIGYSPSLDRVILPVFGEDDLLYWQGRLLANDSTQPKYLNVRSSRPNIYFTVRRESDTVVLVEDILSALAIARAGYNAIAILGSHIPASVQRILPTKKVKVWLDPDKRRESVKYAKMLRAYGFLATPIILPKEDPKKYDAEAVRTIILTGRIDE